MGQILRHITIPGQEGTLDIATSNALTFSGNSSKSFDGSAAVQVTPGDLGLSQALKFVGQTTTTLTDSSTTSPIVINGNNYTPTIGDVVLDSAGNGEFVWLGSYWEALGSEQSYLLKTGGTVTGDLTLSGTNFICNAAASNFNKNVNITNSSATLSSNAISNFNSNVNFNGGPSKYFITNTTSNFNSNVNLTNTSAYLNCMGRIALNGSTTYGTADPSTAISNPVAGQIYFQLVR